MKLKSIEEQGLIRRDFGEGMSLFLKIINKSKKVLDNDK